MEKQIGLTDKELKRFFGQIKGQNSEMVTSRLSEIIYKAYLPLVDKYAKKYSISKDNAQDIFTDTFSGLYNAVIENILEATDFNACFENVMDKECTKFIKQQAEKKQFNSKLLEMSYARTMPAKRVEEIEEAKISLLYTSQLLNELKNNEELAKAHDLTPEKISMLQDYCGLNEKGRCYTVAEIANKYKVSEKRAEVMIVTAKRAVRHMKEFEFIVKR